MNLSQQCSREVLELHQALEIWLGGHVANTDANYARIADVHSNNFTYIVPGGEFIPRDRLFAGLRQAHGANGNNFKIWIENIRTLIETDNLCVLAYEEWQRLPDKTTGRQSTAVFRKNSGTPNGVEWVHIHETWLPETKVAAFVADRSSRVAI